MQAQRAAERGADADVVSAKQQLAAAELDLKAAMRERDVLESVSNQVTSTSIMHLIRNQVSCGEGLEFPP